MFCDREHLILDSFFSWPTATIYDRQFSVLFETESYLKEDAFFLGLVESWHSQNAFWKLIIHLFIQTKYVEHSLCAWHCKLMGNKDKWHIVSSSADSIVGRETWTSPTDIKL